MTWATQHVPEDDLQPVPRHLVRYHQGALLIDSPDELEGSAAD